jgi:hypothetical protein
VVRRLAGALPQRPAEADGEAQHLEAERRATQKWPNSWTATSTPIATMKASTEVNTVSVMHVRRRPRRAELAGGPRAHPSAASAVARSGNGLHRVAFQHAFNDRRDAGKVQPPSRKAATATSFAAFSTAGAVPPDSARHARS